VNPSTVNVVNCPSSKTPQWITQKFCINSFQARVILPPILILAGFRGEVENEKKKGKSKTKQKHKASHYYIKAA